MCAEGALHSFIKSSFTEEPNVLILLDTSGSMSFNMKDDTYTYGDGSRPAVVKNSIQARYFGKDVETSNNDMRNEYYYHPLLRYISTDDLTGISDSDRNTYFKQWDSRVELDDAAPKSGESKYKHPNDSRMYALKNVMYRLLRDEEIYKGLRIGLATYYQVGSSSLPKNAYTDSNFYRWQPYEGFFSSGERQKNILELLELDYAQDRAYERTHQIDLCPWSPSEPQKVVRRRRHVLRHQGLRGHAVVLLHLSEQIRPQRDGRFRVAILQG